MMYVWVYGVVYLGSTYTDLKAARALDVDVPLIAAVKSHPAQYVRIYGIYTQIYIYVHMVFTRMYDVIFWFVHVYTASPHARV